MTEGLQETSVECELCDQEKRRGDNLVRSLVRINKELADAKAEINRWKCLRQEFDKLKDKYSLLKDELRVLKSEVAPDDDLDLSNTPWM